MKITITIIIIIYNRTLTRFVPLLPFVLSVQELIITWKFRLLHIIFSLKICKKVHCDTDIHRSTQNDHAAKDASSIRVGNNQRSMIFCCTFKKANTIKTYLFIKLTTFFFCYKLYKKLIQYSNRLILENRNAANKKQNLFWKGIINFNFLIRIHYNCYNVYETTYKFNIRYNSILSKIEEGNHHEQAESPYKNTSTYND